MALWLLLPLMARAGGSLKLALWAPTASEAPSADESLAHAVAQSLQAVAKVERINTTELTALGCGEYDALVLPQAPLLPAYGGPPFEQRCTLDTQCIAGLASTLSWYLQHGQTSCDVAWHHAAEGQVGPNSTHHLCPAAAGAWHSSQLLLDCVPAVLRAARAANKTSCLPPPPLRATVTPAVGAALFRHASCAGHVVMMGGQPPEIELAAAEVKAAKAGTINVMPGYEPYVLRPWDGSSQPLTVRATRAGLDLRLPDPFVPSAMRWGGVSAIGFAMGDGYAGADRFEPLLELRDLHNRTTGWGASLLEHRASKALNGSKWLLFGISNASFYTVPGTAASLGPLVAATLGTAGATAGGRGMPGEARPTAVQRSRSGSGSGSALWRLQVAPDPPPLPALRLSAARNGSRHFVFTDAATGAERRWFMIGANVYRTATFDSAADPATIAAQFEAASESGCNCVRVFSWDAVLEQPSLRAVATKAARLWGVRVLVELGCKPEKDAAVATQAGTVNATLRAAAALRNDTDVYFAFDLCNEPYFFDVGKIKVGDGANGTTLADLHDYRKHGDDNISAWEAWLDAGSCHATFPNLLRGLPALTAANGGARFAPALADVAAIYTTWLGWRVDAVRSVSDRFLLTVGFNSVYSMLPSVNALLDFTSHHVYPKDGVAVADALPNYCVHNYSASASYVTAFDRLAAAVVSDPGPITYGEFGVSNGDLYRSSLDLAANSPRRFMSLRTQALLDSAVFVRGFAHGADGALHWRLCDHPWPLALSQTSYIGDDSAAATHAKYLSEGRFGLHWYDGVDPVGRRKPLADAMAFLGPYFAAHADEWARYRFSSWDAPRSAVHFEWNVTGPSFLGWGASRVDPAATGGGLSFDSAADDGVVLFADWSGGASDSGGDGATSITLLAASDVRVRLVPQRLSPPVAIKASSAIVSGKYGDLAVDGGGEALEVELLQGERVRVAARARTVTSSGQ